MRVRPRVVPAGSSRLVDRTGPRSPGCYWRPDPGVLWPLSSVLAHWPAVLVLGPVPSRCFARSRSAFCVWVALSPRSRPAVHVRPLLVSLNSTNRFLYFTGTLLSILVEETLEVNITKSCTCTVQVPRTVLSIITYYEYILR